MSSSYIPGTGLDALLNYKYKGGEYSWLDLKLNGFWFACAECLPRWMAPNVVTLIGTFHLAVIVILAMIYDYKLLGESPSWVYFVNAWCLFVYQTMDAVDGKQARRTASSSPLGQLFDHGCDSLGTTFIAVGLLSLLGTGGNLEAILILMTVQVPFYLCQWEENHVHILRAQVANFGVTEGQYLSMFLNAFTGFVGSKFWHHPISEISPIPLPIPSFLSDIKLMHYSVAIGAFFPFLLASSSIKSVALSKANFLRALLLTTPLMLQQGFQICIQQYAPAKNIFSNNPVPIVVMLGFLHSHLSNRIIVASVCHLEFPFIHKILFPAPFIIAYNFHLSGLMDPLSQSNKNQIAFILVAYGIAITIQYLHFVISVTNAITKHLGIYCFTLGKKKA